MSEKYSNPLEPTAKLLTVVIDSLPKQGSLVQVKNEEPEDFYASKFLCEKQRTSIKLSEQVNVLNYLAEDFLVEVTNTGI